MGDGGNFGNGWNSGTANELTAYNATSIFLTGVADGSYHAVQTILNGASSFFYVDSAASSALNAGTLGLNNASWELGDDNFGNFCTCLMREAGLAASNFSSSSFSIASQVNSNQRAYWGF
jgi:hypothetical protein